MQTIEAEAFRWFAVQTRHRHEKRVAERLRLGEVETFLPLHRSLHRWKNGVQAQVDLPLFPSYLFARIRLSQRLVLLKEPGVLSLAASNVAPTPLPDDEISYLRIVAQSFQTQPHPYLVVGERVKIVAGPFAGIDGILQRRKQELRVVISIDVILRSVAVEVSEFEIEPLQERHRRTVA